MSYRNLKLRVSGLGNRIYLGTMSTKHPGVMNDGKVDKTDEAVKAVFQHMATEFERNKSKEHFTYHIDGVGSISYTPEKEGAK